MRFKPRFSGSRMEKKKGKKARDEEKNVEERFQYGSQLGTAVHGNAFESLIVLRKHIFLLLPILRRRALCNWLRHSLLSLLLRLGICFHTGGKDVFFGDACPFRDRERGIESRIMSKGNRATSSPPHRRMHATSARWGSIYHACTENSHPTD